MPNCANCGRNPRQDHLPTCDRDTSLSRWARYRRRKKLLPAAIRAESNAPWLERPAASRGPMQVIDARAATNSAVPVGAPKDGGPSAG